MIDRGEDVLAAGGTEAPSVQPEAMPVAFADPKGSGDVGHRG